MGSRSSKRTKELMSIESDSIEPRSFTIDPRTRPYQPFGGALELFYARDEEILLEGPAGTGKTRAALEKVHLCLLKYAGARALICRKSRVSMTESALVTFEEKVVREGDPMLDGASRSNRTAYHYPNRSELVVGGLDNPNRIMSTEYDMVLVFEATETTEDDFEKLTSRLRNGVIPYQQAIADCNPSAPTHWLNQRAKGEAMHRILSRHEDNPTVTAAYLARLDRLTGARKLRLRNGVWAAQEGLVYEFDAARHIVDAFEIPSEWRRFRVVDFGYTNPFVCQWWAMDADGRLFRYRELYHTRRLVQDHAQQILALSGDEEIEITVCDHDAEDRATLEAAGIPTAAAYKAISPGIEAVQARLRDAGDGRPRLFLVRDALIERDEALVEAKKPVCTEDEFDSYAWPKGSDGRARKEQPVKVDDHGVDTLRYGVTYAEGMTGYAQPSVESVKLWS